MWTEKFKYAEPREPQIGDLMRLSVMGKRKIFEIYSIDEGDRCTGTDGNYYSISKSKQTGYRVDKNGSIVPIANRSKNSSD